MVCFFIICKEFLNNLFLSLKTSWYGKRVMYYHSHITNEDTGAQKPVPLISDLVLLHSLSSVRYLKWPLCVEKAIGIISWKNP